MGEAALVGEVIFYVIGIPFMTQVNRHAEKNLDFNKFWLGYIHLFFPDLEN